MASETYAESVARRNARIEELEAEIDLLQREVTATYQAYDDMMRCKDEDIAELRKQLEAAVLPEDIVWPRFEDGEPVGFGDLYVNANGDRSEVQYIGFKPDGFKVNKGQKRNVWKAYGEPVKRPEPEVLDADGVPIKVGDTVWDSKGESHKVVEINVVDDVEQLIWCGKRLHGMKVFHIANEVTHRKPDTQEAIDADATVSAAVYCVRHGLVESDAEADDATLLERHILDLLARQRKLMGGE